MRVLVVGGAGFIGSHLVDRLLAEDHEVDVIDDLSTGSLSNLADARSCGGALKIHHLDAASGDAETLVGMRRPDLIHLSVEIRARPTVGFEVAANIAEAARRHGVGKVVVALPASVLYGHPSARSLPVKEGALTPRGVRGVVARATLDLFEVYRASHDVEFTALALASVYGSRQRPDGGVVAAFNRCAETATAPIVEGDGRQTRDFLFIDDAIDALVRANDHGAGLLINIGTGVQTTIRDLWARVGSGSDIRAIVAPARHDDLARFAVSPVRARIHLAWSPFTELDEGLARVRSSN